MVDEVREPYRPTLRREGDKHDRARRLGLQSAEPARQIEHHGGSRSVVVGAVMNLSFALRGSWRQIARAKMIVVGADDDIFVCQLGVGAGEICRRYFPRALTTSSQIHLQADVPSEMD